MSLRVSAGLAKSKPLKSPDIPGIKLTQEIARLAVFAIISDGITEASCLDLFAGSGVVGIEALSRGAAKCDFVDHNIEATKTIKENLKLSGLTNKATVETADALKYVANTAYKYDLVFLDPFYHLTQHKHLFKLLPKILKKNATVIFFHGANLNVDELITGSTLIIKDSRKYGATTISILVDRSH
ncbi:MAG: RsmD family RNA methyltransferase [Patescibacteria group bacterium]